MLNHILNFFTLLLVYQNICLINTSCGPDLVTKPCLCIHETPYYDYLSPLRFEHPPLDEQVIVCENIVNTSFNLQEVFIKLSSYTNSISNQNQTTIHFTTFVLSNTTITTIPENVFVNITFRSLMLRNNCQLTTIHPNAFLYSKDYVESFETINTSLSNSELIFSILRQFQNLRYLSMRNDQLKSIPSYALNHTYLSHIYFGSEYPKQTQPIETIGNYAFYNLSNLDVLHIFSPVLTKITKYAFAQQKLVITDDYERWPLRLSIGGERLTSSSFELTSLNRFRSRIVYLYFYDTSITYLDENNFQPFLESNPASTITISSGNNLFECDCQSAWVKGDYWRDVNQWNQKVHFYQLFGCNFTLNCTIHK